METGDFVKKGSFLAIRSENGLFQKLFTDRFFIYLIISVCRFFLSMQTESRFGSRARSKTVYKLVKRNKTWKKRISTIW